MQLPQLTTLADYVALYARQTPDAPAIWHEGREISYGEFDALIEDMAGSLAAAGLTAGQRVAVLSTPRPEFLISLLAAFRIGAVWVGLNPRYTYRELAHVVSESKPELILALSELDGRQVAPTIVRLAAEYEIAGVFRLVSDDVDTALAKLPQPVGYPEHEPDRFDPATIVFTSGSSGSPKGAVLSHRGLVYAAVVEAQELAVTTPRVPCNLPINHIASIVDLCGTTLVAGGMVALVERFDPSELLDLIEELRLTNLSSVPTVLQAISGRPDFTLRDLSSLQVVSWGGAPLSFEAIRAYRARGVRLATVYGMTETIASITFTDPEAVDEVLGHTVGRFDRGMRVRLANDSECEVPLGEQGEVQVKHEGLFLEYFGRPDATRDAYTSDGWFKTGDVGVLRLDGNLRLVGRKSDMIKSGGYNVYPREIELCLEERDDVVVAAVVGRPDDTYGEAAVAFVTPVPGSDVDPVALRAFCRERLANYKIPKQFFAIDEMPLLPVGKIDKQELKRQVSSGPSV